MDNEYYMRIALEEGRKALERNEFPVGCVLVCDGRVIAEGRRKGTSDGRKNEIFHAEINALTELDRIHPSPDRSRITLFSTMEPCLMCFGAALISGIDRFVYAYEDVMGGGTGCDLSRMPPLYRDRNIRVTGNVLRRESLSLFRQFFENPDNDYWKGSLLADYTMKQPLQERV